MPVYRIDRHASEPRVVEAKTPAAARAHVAKDEITVTKIGTAEAMRLMSSTPGLTLETAGEEAEPGQQQEEMDPDRQREDKEERDRLAAESPDEE